MTIIGMILILLILYTLAVRGRHGHPGLTPLKNWSYAHRGLHKPGIPENSMAAFRAALEKGYGIELDVHLLKDGTLAVIHDHSLKRTAGADVQIEELTAEELRQYHLEGTDETIPTFRQVLELFDGKAPLIVELKAIGGNYAALTDTAVQMLRDYPGAYCMESFDPRCILHLKKHYPHIIRGQLAQNFFKSKTAMPWFLRLMLTLQLENFLLLPDFVAYNVKHSSDVSRTLCQKLFRAPAVAWTVRSQEQMDENIDNFDIFIFEGFTPQTSHRMAR